MFKPAAEMTNVYARNSTGQIVCLRLCHSCANPVLTYIAGRLPAIPAVDIGRLLIASLALILVILDVVLGLVIGSAVGFGLAIAGMLVGAGILASLAATAK